MRAPPRGRQPLRPEPDRHPAPRDAGAESAHPLQARRRLRREGRRGHHRRRVHRPADARTALVRRVAPGRRGEGGGEDREREPDARHDHHPELLPHVRQARRDDGHRRHRGGRVQGDLQARRRGGAAQQDHAPDRPRRPGLQERAREARRRRAGDRRVPRARAAGAGRHHVGREVGARVQASQEGRHPAQRAERHQSRGGSQHHRPGRALPAGHDRDEHGRSRHRHPARWQPRVPGAGRDGERVDPRLGEGVGRACHRVALRGHPADAAGALRR